jgi:hypothetical protein
VPTCAASDRDPLVAPLNPNSTAPREWNVRHQFGFRRAYRFQDHGCCDVYACGSPLDWNQIRTKVLSFVGAVLHTASLCIRIDHFGRYFSANEKRDEIFPADEYAAPG